MTRTRRTWWGTGTAALVIGLPVALAAGPIERRIYPAPAAPLSIVGMPPGAAMITASTADGLAVRGIMIAPATGRPVVLAFHGNGSSAADAVRWLSPALPAGYGLVAAEYRGYSGNPGKPSETGLAVDADAFVRHAEELAHGAPVVVFGHSLGGGVALGLARRHQVAAVVTVGTFTRLRDNAPKLARALVPDAYRNIDIVPELAVPYFLVHGTDDDVIPAGQGEQLHLIAGKAKRQGASFVVLNGGHAPATGDIAAVMHVVARFLTTNATTADGLPATIKLIPFGGTKPVNP